MVTPFPAVPGSGSPGIFTPGDPGAAGAVALNQWTGTVTNDPGLVLVPVANAGNALVAYVGWNDKTFPFEADISVTDDAHNYWQPLGVTNAGTGVRGAIWIAPNAAAATVVSISCSSPVSGLAGLVAEFPGLPQLAQADFTAKISTVVANSDTVSATATGSDWTFGVLVSSDNTVTITEPGGPWTLLNTVTVNDPLSGAGGIADTAIFPVYSQVGAGALSLAYTASTATTLALVMVSIKNTFTPVTNPGNPNWPVFQVLAAFGAQPGSNQTAYVWTDITSRAYFEEGSTILDVTRGRSYELTGPEAGTVQIWLSNTDGALDPANSSSPYYPNVLPETPIKVLATWNNTIYSVAYGYVDKWPQQFPSPQWPMTNVSASDSMGILANLTLYSAYQCEVLLDNPYGYWPFGESYGEANGLPFDNLGSFGVNATPMVGIDGQSTNSVPLSTGLSLNLQGDSGSGIGLTGLTVNPQLWSSGAINVDPGLTLGVGQGLLSVECWASVPTTPPSGGSFTTPLVSLLGPPTNFGSGGGPVRFQAAIVSGSPYKTQVTLADFLGNTFTSSAFSYPNDGNLHHHVFTVAQAGGTWTISHYLDGALDTSVTNVTVSSTALGDVDKIAVGPAFISPLASNPYNYTIAHVAVYGSALPAIRVNVHYKVGIMGMGNEIATTRFKRIMGWSQSHLAMAGTLPSAAPLMGAAFSLDGQAVTDALNDLVVSEGGWPYADAAGNVWWASRASFYNRSPKWVFGDNPANGETPYDPGQSFDFDNSFLYTQVQTSRNVGQSTQITTNTTQGVTAQSFTATGAQARVASLTARKLYGNRNSLQHTILTNSDQDVYDRGWWSLSKYSASSFRIPQIVIDAASNPNLWPVVLGVEQGDVVQVIRRPVGAPAYIVTGVVVQVHVEVGVNKGQATLGIVPYNIEAAVIQVDDPVYGTLANGIGW